MSTAPRWRWTWPTGARTATGTRRSWTGRSARIWLSAGRVPFPGKRRSITWVSATGRIGARTSGHAGAPAGDRRHDLPDETLAAANDNALTRIARDVRRTAFAWRHRAAVDAFAAGRQEVLASWDELRARTRTEDDAVALGDIYIETLDRHAALLRQAEPFRARPEAFTALLSERGRIGVAKLMTSSNCTTAPAATAAQPRCGMCIVRSRRQSSTRSGPRRERDAAAAAGNRGASGQAGARGRRGEALTKAQTLPPDTAAAPSSGRGDTPVDSTPTPPPPEPSKPGWRVAWDPVVGEWNALVERARQSGTLAFYTGGYAGLIPRIRALVETPDIPSDGACP